MKISHLVFLLDPGSGRWSVTPTTINRRGPAPAGFAKLHSWSRVTRVPAGWNPAIFSDREATMFADCRRYAMKEFPQARAVVWEALSPRVIQAALEFGSQTASELLLGDFLGLKIPSQKLGYYDDAWLMDEIFGWHARWVDLTMAARLSRKHVPDFFRFARNQWRSLRRSLETTGLRPTKGWGSGELAKPEEAEPGVSEGYVNYRPLDGMPLWKIATLERHGDLYIMPQPKIETIGIEGINRTLLWRPTLPVAVVEGPTFDPNAGRAVLRFPLDKAPESVWLQVLHNNINPGRRRKAIAAELPSVRTSSISNISVSESETLRHAPRLSKRDRKRLEDIMWERWPGCGAILQDMLVNTRPSLSVPWAREAWYLELKPMERRWVNWHAFRDLRRQREGFAILDDKGNVIWKDGNPVLTQLLKHLE